MKVGSNAASSMTEKPSSKVAQSGFEARLTAVETPRRLRPCDLFGKVDEILQRHGILRGVRLSVCKQLGGNEYRSIIDQKSASEYILHAMRSGDEAPL